MKKRVIGTFLLLYCMIMTAACPVSSADLAHAKEASKKVAGYSNAGVNLTRELWHAHFLTEAQKDFVATKFIQLSDLGIAYDFTVAAVESQYGPNAPPRSEIERLMGLFNSQLVAGLLDVLTSLKVIPSHGNYAATIQLIIDAVLVVAGIFGIRRQTQAKISAAMP